MAEIVNRRWNLGVGFADGAGDVIRLWGLADAREIRRFEVDTRGVTCLAFSPGGRHLATGDAGGVVRVWDVDSGRGLLGFRDHRGPVQCVAFSADGARLVSADGLSLVLRRASDGKPIGRYDLTRELRIGPQRRVESVAISCKRGYLLAGCRDGAILLWRLPRPARR